MLAAVVEFVVELVAAQRAGRTDDDEFVAGTGDGHVHAAEVGEKTDLPFLVGANEADHHHIALLPLEGVDRVDRDESAQRAEVFVALDEPAQVLHLCAVGRDDAEVSLGAIRDTNPSA